MVSNVNRIFPMHKSRQRLNHEYLALQLECYAPMALRYEHFEHIQRFEYLPPLVLRRLQLFDNMLDCGVAVLFGRRL